MTWTTSTKNTTDFTSGTKHTAGADWNIPGFLLQENTFYVLQESGDKIVLQLGATKNDTEWTNINKS